KEFAQPLSVFIFISETPGRNKIYFISFQGWTTSKARRQLINQSQCFQPFGDDHIMLFEGAISLITKPLPPCQTNLS
ncbi:hypothetical protein, partial [Escherichia coli]